jgi:hypothetical protein
MNQYIDRMILQTPKNCFEYYEFIQVMSTEILNNGEDEINNFNLRKESYKQIVEEAFPISLFAKHYFEFNKYIYIKHCIDDKIRQLNTKSYDAEITDHDGNFTNEIHFLEVLYPTDGEASKVATQQMILARKNGIGEEMSVSYNGKTMTDKSRPKGSQKIISNDHYTDFDQNALIISKILEKNKIKYPPATVLIVSFDDALFHISDDSLEGFYEYMHENLSGRVDKFLFVAFIARSGEYYFELR